MDDHCLSPSSGPVIGIGLLVGSKDNPDLTWMLDLANLSFYLAGIPSSNFSTPTVGSSPET